MVASGVALWSATRIEDRVFDHDVFWMAGIGVLSLAVTGELVLSVAASSGMKALRPPAGHARLAGLGVPLMSDHQPVYAHAEPSLHR